MVSGIACFVVLFAFVGGKKNSEWIIVCICVSDFVCFFVLWMYVSDFLYFILVMN
jgi:hypothetical protein